MTADAWASGRPTTPAEIVSARTRRRIEIFADAGDDWRFAESLKSVSEDTAQEYEGRALFELIQNGHDALGDRGLGRIRIVLADDSGEFGTLYVANEGHPFALSNFAAITELGLSDKAAGEGIGNKGLGFRSVLQLSDWPEVYSKAQTGGDSFDGFCFRFASPDDVRDLVHDRVLAEEVIAKVSPLALPVPAEVTDQRVANLGVAGFSTVVRLPLRNDWARDAAREQLEALTAYEVPILLFLNRLSAIEVELEAESGWVRELRRAERSFEPLAGLEWLSEVDLGTEGRFLRAVRAVPAAAMRDAIEASIEAREIDEKWRDWEGAAEVSIAVGLDEPVAQGRLYTFLPMSQTAISPFAGHAHAPFFTKLARLDISEGVALNRHLVDQIAALARDLLRTIAGLPPTAVPIGTTIDLACWNPPDRIRDAFADVGSSILGEAFVPAIGKPGWATLEDSYVWPFTRADVVTARAVSRLGVKVLDDAVGQSRCDRLERLHQALVGRSMNPDPSECAQWCEDLAARQLRDHANLDRWADFYDDLAVIFGGNPTALVGRAVILDQDERLVPALGGTDDRASKQTVFFAPEDVGADAPVSRLPRDLRALRRRIAFTHPGLAWNFPGNPPRRRPGRAFLEPSLVREYRTDRVFEAIDELLQQTSTDAFRRDALIFAFRQFPTLNESQRGQLRRYRFQVPTANGSWRRATDALFHPGWGTETALLLESFLSDGGGAIPGFARLIERRVAPPSTWPEPVEDVEGWYDFLKCLGVRDGLLPFVYDAQRAERDGNDMRPERLAALFKFDDSLKKEWPLLVRSGWSDFAHPWTRYAFDNGLSHIPGMEAAGSLGVRARRELAELILTGLPTWGDHNFAVRLRRPGRAATAQDPHTWPTPLAAQIRSAAWIPLTDESAPDGFRFVRPDEAWFAPDGELPAFVPSIPSSIRRLLQEPATLRRLKDLGLRVWGDPRHGPELVRELGDLLNSGLVPAHLSVHFRKHYQRGWGETVRSGRWPWQVGQDVRLAVTECSSLAALDGTGNTPVFVPDEDHQLKESLLDVAGYPVLVAAAEDGHILSGILATNGVQARRFTEIEVKIESNGSAVAPSADWPLLVACAPWLPMLFGLVLELKSGEFRRRSERTVRELMDKVGSIRLARIDAVNVVIEGEAIGAPPAARSLPVADERFPTIVVWDAAPGWAELRAASVSICQLLSQTALQAPLELALVKLESRLDGGAVPQDVDDADLASALDAPAHRVSELRRGLTGALVEAIHRLRPVLVCLLDVGQVEEVTRELQSVGDLDALPAALGALFDKHAKGEERLQAADVLAAARSASSLAEVRDLLTLEFGRFNAALVALGQPYRPITHPELQANAFADFVAAIEPRIIDLLRESYAVAARLGHDVSPYVEARRLDGLEPDPDWLLRYETPPASEMENVVQLWLASHGARKLGCNPNLPDLSELRERNFAEVNAVIEAAGRCIGVWCAKHAVAIPTAWANMPAMAVRSLIEGQGLADLVDLSGESILERAATALGWPSGMDVTTVPEALGLSAEDLLLQSPAPVNRGSSPRRQSTIRLGENTLDVGTDHLRDIARAAHDSIDESFLSQKGTAHLGDVPSAASGGGGASGGGRIVVARMPRMTEDQRTAVGLVGEVAARAWLERRYPEVRWRSGYAAVVVGDVDASDGWGYDFEVPHRNSSLLFEVKSLVDEPRDLAEFEMGDSEVRVAQSCAGGDRYRILLVTSVLEPASRRVFVLPSPFSKKGSGRFRVIGRGLRYQCQMDT